MTPIRYSARFRAGVAFAASLAIPALCTAQRGPQPDPTKALPPTVYSNPRSGPDDPRIGLKPGLYDAGEAIFGLEKIATLQKPPGFAPGPQRPGTPSASRWRSRRWPRRRGPTLNTGSTNSDLAFIGNHLFVGNYNGINFYDIDNPAKIKLGTSLVCPGGQGDVSVYGHLLFMSAEAMNGRIDCGTQGIPVPVAATRAGTACRAARSPRTPEAAAAGRGGRRPRRPPVPTASAASASSISATSANPKQVAAVQSCRGSHTHTPVGRPQG